MTNFFRRLAVYLESGEPAFVAIVVDNTRHSPGTRGARMFVSPNGLQVGTIGGGIMEARLVNMVLNGGREASQPPEGGPSVETLQHRRDPTEGTPSGLICAGQQTMLYFTATAEHLELFTQIADAIDDDEELVLVVDEHGPSIEPGAADPGRPPIFFETSPNGFVYREQLLNYKRVAIIGSGHCGEALSKVMFDLGYHVTVFEVRPNVFTFVDNEWAHEKHTVSDYVDAGPLIRHPELTHLVVMTADYPSDVRALLGAIDLPFPYKGVMGSPAKLEAIFSDLRAAGVNEDAIASLYAPIGLDMASNTPEEIAVSVAAQILRERQALFVA